MPKASQTPLIRTARLLDLVPYLVSHPGVELKKLAEGFNVSVNQMIADLTTLWMCGLPGYTPLELMDLSFESGFVNIHNAETLSHPRNLSGEESIALLLGLDLVMDSLPPDRIDLKELSLALIGKLSDRSNLPAKLTATSSVPGTLRSLIESAISKKQFVEIVYHSSYSDLITTRIVHPIELSSENGVEYLKAICKRARALRTFRLDRIQSARISKETNAPVVGGGGSNEARISYTIRAHSRLREVMERFSLTEVSLGKDLEISSFSTEWISRSVLASSGSVELIGPGEIRQGIAQLANRILNRYKGL